MLSKTLLLTIALVLGVLVTGYSCTKQQLTYIDVVDSPAGDLLSIQRTGYEPPAGIRSLPSPHGERLSFHLFPTLADLGRIEAAKPASLDIPFWWFESMFNQPRFSTVKSLQLIPYHSQSISLTDVRIHGEFKSVIALQIPHVTGVDRDLAGFLRHFPSLVLLDVSKSDLGDDSFAALLADNNLRHLYVSGTQITSSFSAVAESRMKDGLDLLAYDTPLESVCSKYRTPSETSPVGQAPACLPWLSIAW